MKKCTLIFGLIVTCILSLTCCKVEVQDAETFDPMDFRNEIKQWEGQKSKKSKKNEVALTVTDDIDFLFWTKNNGEIIYSDKNCKMGNTFYSNEKLSFAKREEPYIFDFSGLEQGNYILDIHYKDTKKNTDNDFRGFVSVNGLVEISDKINGKNCGGSCDKMARFTIYNDSSLLLNNIHGKERPGNKMTEFIFVDYDSNKTYNDYIYKSKFKFTDITLIPGAQVNVLLPMGRDKDVKKNGFLLKKVIDDGKTIYYGNTTTEIYKFGFGSPMEGTINNEFIPKENGFFYSDWKVEH